MHALSLVDSHYDFAHGHSAVGRALDLCLDDIHGVADEPAALASDACAPHLDHYVEFRVVCPVSLGLVHAELALEELVGPEVDSPPGHVSQQQGEHAFVDAPEEALVPQQGHCRAEVLYALHAVHLGADLEQLHRVVDYQCQSDRTKLQLAYPCNEYKAVEAIV